MSIRHDSPAWFRRIRDEGGPVAQGRAVPLREVPQPVPHCFGKFRSPVHDAEADCAACKAEQACWMAFGASTTAQPPQAAHAPPAAPETGLYAQLTPEQRKAVLAYDGPEVFGGAEYLDPIVASVCALLLSRSAVGIAKYQTTLAANPLSRKQWLIHMRDELLDGALYAQRMIEMEDGE